MEKDNRYILDKGTKKFICPSCGKKRFVRYIDTYTNEYLPSEFGRCDREVKCAYFNDPYTTGYASEMWKKENNWKYTETTYNKHKPATPPQPPIKEIYFDADTFQLTLKNYHLNTFIQNLLNNIPFPFNVEDVTKAIELYRLGTLSKGYRSGAITFPFIDIEGNIRAVQVKQFDKSNHTIATDFLHSILDKAYKNNKPDWLSAYMKQDKRVSCLFGEHLLKKYPNNTIALVEAPKTAIYGTLYFGSPEDADNLLWLAVYNKSSFSFDKIKALHGRNIIVFPDLSSNGNTFKEWKNKAEEFEMRLPGTKFIFSDLLERLASEEDKQMGYDIADILQRFDWRCFRNDAAGKAKEQQIRKPIESVSQKSAKQNPIDTRDKQTLIYLTEKLIQQHSNISKDDLIDKIMIETSASKERARNGFELMLSNKIIENAINDRYFLSYSTPF